MRDDLEFRTFLRNKSACNHPIYGTRIFLVPHAGQEFLNENSLNGDREVKLDQQTWKLLFTENNHIMKLRYQKLVEPQNDEDDEKNNQDDRNLEEMKRFLLQSIMQSKHVAQDDEIDDEGNSIYISPFFNKNLIISNSQVSKPEQPDVIQSSSFVHVQEGDALEIKEKNDEKEVPVEAQASQEEQKAPEEEKVQEHIPQPLEKSVKKESVEYVGGMEIRNDEEEDQKQELGLVVESVKSEEVVVSEAEQEVQVSSSSDSDSSEELQEEEEQEIRKVIQKEIDEICTSIFHEEMQRRKDEEREKKFDELFLQRLGSQVQQVLVDDQAPEVPEVDRQDYQNERANRLSIAFVKNPYESRDKEIVPVEIEEEVQESIVKPVKEPQEFDTVPYIPAPKMFEEVPSFEQKETRKETIPLIVQPIIGNAFKPKPPQGYQNPYGQIPEGAPPAHQDLPVGDQIMKGAQGGAIKPGGVVVPPQQKQHQQLKQRIVEEEKKEGVVNQIKVGMRSVIQFFKDTSKIRKNTNYKWGPVDMASIVKEVRDRGNILTAEKKRLSDQAVCPPKQQYRMEVKVVNLSQYIWPKEVYVDLVKTNKKIKFSPQRVAIKLPPGGQGTVKISFITPKHPGKYDLVFGLRGIFEKKQQMYFGELIDLKLWVREPRLDDQNTGLYQNAEKLHQEGLGEFEECVRVLKLYRMDYHRAREALYQRIYRMK